MGIFDLTRPIAPAMPVYPGDPQVEFQQVAHHSTDGFCVHRVVLGTHAGTHLDAPAHFMETGAGVDALPLGALVGPARVIQLPFEPMWVEPGERVLVASGWSDYWEMPGYFDAFPGLPQALVEALVAAPAALVGLETPSLHPDHDLDARFHHQLLEAGVVIVENLVGLARLPARVHLTALPLPLRGLDGAPCRVVATEMKDGMR